MDIWSKVCLVYTELYPFYCQNRQPDAVFGELFVSRGFLHCVTG
jgi:hypothetical protein